MSGVPDPARKRELSRRKRPVVLVHGLAGSGRWWRNVRDHLVPARLADDWLHALPDARLVLLDAGHVPMWDAPDELVRVVRDFLEEPAHERADEARPRVMDGVGLSGDDGEPPAR